MLLDQAASADRSSRVRSRPCTCSRAECGLYAPSVQVAQVPEALLASGERVGFGRARTPPNKPLKLTEVADGLRPSPIRAAPLLVGMKQGARPGRLASRAALRSLTWRRWAAQRTRYPVRCVGALRAAHDADTPDAAEDPFRPERRSCGRRQRECWSARSPGGWCPTRHRSCESSRGQVHVGRRPFACQNVAGTRDHEGARLCVFTLDTAYARITSKRRSHSAPCDLYNLLSCQHYCWPVAAEIGCLRQIYLKIPRQRAPACGSC